MKKQTVTLTRPKFRNYSIMAFVLGMVSGAALYHLSQLSMLSGGMQP